MVLSHFSRTVFHDGKLAKQRRFEGYLDSQTIESRFNASSDCQDPRHLLVKLTVKPQENDSQTTDYFQCLEQRELVLSF